MIIYLIIVCITQFHTKLSQIPCCVVIPKSRNERSPFRGTGMIYSGKQVLSWTLKVGGKAVDFFFFFLAICSALHCPICLGVYHSASVFSPVKWSCHSLLGQPSPAQWQFFPFYTHPCCGIPTYSE